jgi:hypothetical protein
MAKFLKARTTKPATKPIAPRLRPRPAQAKPAPEPDAFMILKRVKIRSFSQCRAVASRILRELINGTIPPERVRYSIPLLQVIVSCNQSIYLRGRLQRIQEALNLDIPPVEGEDPGEEESEMAEDVLESAEATADEPDEPDEPPGAYRTR